MMMTAPFQPGFEKGPTSLVSAGNALSEPGSRNEVLVNQLWKVDSYVIRLH
jgi:hypothetical protein